MSKVLRRPMFRGGRVDSRGTGITSGLMNDTGYADGGSVVPKRGLVDGPGGYAGDYFSAVPTFISEFGTSIINPEKEYGKRIEDIAKETSYQYQDPSYVTGLSSEAPPRIMTLEELNLTTEKGKTGYLENLKKQRDEQIKNILKKSENLSEYQKNEIFNQYGITKNDLLNIGKKEDEGVNKIVSKTTPTPKTRREEILDEAALYREALGYDEAKSQALYDALGAAAPAFFKGKNLREAAPEVLTAINKSGAFDKPRDIKQAAAQLAVQRRMLADKAAAEERARLAIYGLKNEKSVIDLLKIQGSFLAGPLPKGFETNEAVRSSFLLTARPGGIYEGPNGEYFYAVPDSKGKGVSGLQKVS